MFDLAKISMNDIHMCRLYCCLFTQVKKTTPSDPYYLSQIWMYLALKCVSIHLYLRKVIWIGGSTFFLKVLPQQPLFSEECSSPFSCQID
jgi:hypothetical protein